MIITIQGNGYLVKPQNQVEQDTIVQFLQAQSQNTWQPAAAEAAFQASVLPLPTILDPKIPLP